MLRSWTMLLEQVKHVRKNPTLCKTLVIDTADWAELLCANDVCAKANKLRCLSKYQDTSGVDGVDE